LALQANKDELQKVVSQTYEYVKTNMTIEQWIQQFDNNTNRLRFWKNARLASFCLTALSLDLNHPRQESQKVGLNILKLKWAAFNTSDISSMSEYELTLMTLIYQTLANQIIQELITEIRTYHDRSGTPRNTGSWALPPTEAQPKLPALDQIPFSMLMHTYAPFNPRSSQLFGSAHIKVMANPEFFTAGEWTGYFVEVGRTERFSEPEYRSAIRGGPPLPFVTCKGMGVLFEQYHQGGFWDRGAPFPMPLEDSLHFQLSHFVNNESQFVLMTNSFTMLGYAFQFVLTVDRKTGLVNVKGAYPSKLDFQGIITPFGLLLASNSGLWFWFWKKSWNI
jgi:hypothetical protein